MESSNPIFVTGVERSGSSIVARIITMCGAFCGEVTEMQENKHLKEFVNHFYNYHNADPRGQYPLPELDFIPIPPFWKEKVDVILEKDRYTGKCPWMYKSSRIAQIWPVWHNAYPEAKWIIVRRRTGDIIQSCIKTGFMTAYTNESILQQINAKDEADGWLWWIHEQEQLFSKMFEAGLNIQVIWPERMAVGDFEQIKEMLDWLGLEWTDKIIEMVQPLLKNSKQKERS